MCHMMPLWQWLEVDLNLHLLSILATSPISRTRIVKQQSPIYDGENGKKKKSHVAILHGPFLEHQGLKICWTYFKFSS